MISAIKGQSYSVQARAWKAGRTDGGTVNGLLAWGVSDPAVLALVAASGLNATVKAIGVGEAELICTGKTGDDDHDVIGKLAFSVTSNEVAEIELIASLL